MWVGLVDRPSEGCGVVRLCPLVRITHTHAGWDKGRRVRVGDCGRARSSSECHPGLRYGKGTLREGIPTLSLIQTCHVVMQLVHMYVTAVSGLWPSECCGLGHVEQSELGHVEPSLANKHVSHTSH